MGRVTCQLSMSLDGYVAGPHQSPAVTHIKYRVLPARDTGADG